MEKKPTYVEVNDKGTTSVWTHFLKEKNGHSAKCKTCNRVLKSGGGSTSALHSHLKLVHKINLLKRSCESTSSKSITQPLSPQQKISNMFLKIEDDTLPAVLSRMTASDGIPMSVFCTSKDMRKLLNAKGYFDVPKCPKTIRTKIIEYATKIRENVISEIDKNRANGLSLTFDEWTSTRNRRYLNINVHSGSPKGQFWNLGLVRIHGSLPAEKCIQLVNSKLNDFRLSLETDIVSITTDGAAVMQKIGRLITPGHQLCLAHGIQLAVLAVLYKFVLNDAMMNPVVDEYDKSDTDAVEGDGDFEQLVSSIDIGTSDHQSELVLNHAHLVPIISKTRTVVKLFRLSPTRNDDILQKYVKTEMGKEKALILDTRTRWNSLLAMIERFYSLRSCIQKALIDMNSDIKFSEVEFQLMNDTIDVLQPIQYAVESLCRQDADLLTAEATMKFLLNNLSQNKSSLAAEMKDALEFRIKQRRTNFSALLNYLHNGMELEVDDTIITCFPKLSKNKIKIALVDLAKRFVKVSDQQNEIETNVTESRADAEIEAQINVKHQMQKAIEMHLIEKPKKTSENYIEL